MLDTLGKQLHSGPWSKMHNLLPAPASLGTPSHLSLVSSPVVARLPLPKQNFSGPFTFADIQSLNAK